MKKHQLLLLASLFLLFIVIVSASYASTPVFDSYYKKLTSTLHISGTRPVEYLLQHPEIGHILCYGLLALLSFFAFKKSYLVAFSLPFSVGILCELLQIFSPTRSMNVIDLLMNVIGIAAPLIVIFLFGLVGRTGTASGKPVGEHGTSSRCF